MSVAVTDVQALELGRQEFCPDVNAPVSMMQTYLSQAARPGAGSWVGQQEASDCGLACLAMIAKSRGADLSMAALRARVSVRPDGLSVGELHELARGCGFLSRAVRIGPRQLRDLNEPVIAHLTDGHYVVIFAVGDNEIVLGDPAKGIVTVSPGLFERTWSGGVLLFPPSTPQ